jgi:hypothetical protein
MDGDVKDYSGNNHNATSNGVQQVADARGEPGKAYRFTDGRNIIDVPNASSLNFQNQITLSFWLKLDEVPAESYVLSHGSYQERWKVSVIPNNKIRWTVKTVGATTDLDSSFPLQQGQFYHFTVVYSGYSMELYVNGQLNAFLPNVGLINVASDDITFGRETAAIQSYSLYGTLDEVRIYDKALGPNEIKVLQTLWNNVTAIEDNSDSTIVVYPNPSTGKLNVKGIRESVLKASVADVMGRDLSTTFSMEESGILQVNFNGINSGILILKIETSTKMIYRKILY